MENIETAILLMVVGMATVFVILLIVIYLGKLLITLVNKYVTDFLFRVFWNETRYLLSHSVA